MKSSKSGKSRKSTQASVRMAVQKSRSVSAISGELIEHFEKRQDEKTTNPFRDRQLRPGHSSSRGTLTGGTDSTQIISDDRDSR